MATINFYYRSKKEEANLILKLRFNYDSKSIAILCNTPIRTTKHFWNEIHPKQKIKDAELRNKQIELNKSMNDLKEFVFNKFDKYSLSAINKEWLQATLNEFYKPIEEEKEEETVSEEILQYFDTFIEYKQNEVSTSSIKKYNVIKQLLLRFQEEQGSTILIKNIDLEFKKDFESYCLKENYSTNTIARAIRTIKTVCNHANQYKGIEVSKNLVNIKVKYERVKHIYLNESDLLKLESLKDSSLSEYLINAKDWLLISCYTGQRVSDFLRFTKDMIRLEKNKKGELKPFIEFTQQKTNKRMIVPLQSKVMAILDKRKGNFPRKVSDQRYNEYIKEVCELAQINEVVSGSKKVLINEKKKLYRKQEGKYPKFKLVASHIGRRSFATNNYGNIPTSYLLKITGHTTEKMLLEYIGKSNKDFAMDIMEYFD